ncbi:transporter [Rhodospirillum rubrum]|uniref:BON domain-containing protein n=1 Tax=Rhodospirillum rubrum TaxID=1085 RepID=UPI0019064F6F|nr:BON domain-containing protein [Rhodospirillum rubrum]MBK1663162.1 transporter [Rhodospirillum rubrum]MBK1675179.1 transporter [Rhodospirillum rubrum]
MNKLLKATMVAFALTSVVGVSACAQSGKSQSTGAYIDDAAITTKVKAAILDDEMLKVMEIKVSTYQQVVQLSGFVEKPAMVGRAGRVARGVEGVKAVKNDLHVK